MSASDAKKRRKAANAARAEALRVGYFAMAEDGRQLEPGTREYEKRLRQVAASLSESEFQGLIGELGPFTERTRKSRRS